MSLSVEVLERLVAFDTVSDRSNLPLIDYVQDFLITRGFRVARFNDPAEPKAGLLAEIGPQGPGGLLLSAHSDVVPVEGQSWTRPPFKLTRGDGHLFGRGTTDMKGFVAEMLALADAVQGQPLRAPLKLLISYDEEIGCVGIARMADWLRPRLGQPQLAIVGEPTEMQVALGHKGKRSYQVQMTGEAGHSALAPRFVSALHVAVDFVAALRALQEDLRAGHARAASGYTTVHVGQMESGRALNIVPDHATLMFEFRHVAADDPEALAQRVSDIAEAVAVRYDGKTSISLTPLAAYPGLDVPATHPAAILAQSWSGSGPCTVDFGTEAGVLSQLGVPTVVCGPGSMAKHGHKADEAIARDQLSACAHMLRRAAEDTVFGVAE